MTNQDIETFFAVLDHGTMTAAAEALYITQPSLSARLKSLEDQVGAPLFHRGKGQRRITLTDAGQHFLPLARRWQNLLSETQTFAAAEKREFLHVIAAYTANQYILPPVYQRFLERELPVNLWVESMRTDQAVSAVARGDADMAIVDGALHYDLQIEAKPLFREGFFLVVPKTVALTEPVEATTLHVQDEILIYGQPEIQQWHDYWFGVDARPLLYGEQEEVRTVAGGDRTGKALTLLHKAIENHVWRQEQCVNLIPSENTPSRAVRLLSGSDPACRYAEHKKVLAFYDREVFYYQGTKFIDEVERLLVEEMRAYFGCTEVESRTLSGQMSNMAVFSALMDWKNRVDRKHDAKRLGYVMNNHIIKGGHLSAQPMGALHDYIAIDPVTEKPAVVNFPVCADNPYKMDVEETKKLIERYRPELIIFGKSMVLHKEPVAAIRQFVDEQKIPTTIMYDMAHVLGLIGDHFQNPFAEGAEIVTGSTHKTFFGPQRGIIGVNYKEDDLKYGLWKTIESRTFPGSVSNHHLGTQVGMLMAAYEMNQFKDEYQKAVIQNAKSFARSLKAEGLDVMGDPAIDYTETHQVIVSVGYGEGAEIANRLERNNVIVNYQATPDEEGFTASGALRMGVSEMTRFGFGEKEFAQLASLMADCILRGREIGPDVAKLRAQHLEMGYCFNDEQFETALEKLAEKAL